MKVVLWIASLAVTATFANADQARAGDAPNPAAPGEAYIGVNAGYSFGLWNATSSEQSFPSETLTVSPDVNGVLGGLQAGFNWQPIRDWVWGIEADMQFSGARGLINWSDPNYAPRPGGAASLSNEWNLPWFTTGRVRVGYTPVPRLLIYGTAGPAFGVTEYKFNFLQPGAAGATSYSLSTKTDSVGFALGAGVESKLGTNWSVRLESLYLDFGTTSINTGGIDGAPLRTSYRVRQLIARTGFNYAFW
jgi:outer membrane immunogenic protein